MIPVRQPYKAIIFVALGLVVLLAIAKITSALINTTSLTTAMEPGIKENQMIFSSNLIGADRFDVIQFRHNDPTFGNVVWFFRVCGLPGDIVEIRNGVLYVNEVNADSNLNLKHEYILSRKDATGFITEEHENVVPTESGDKIPEGKYFVLGDNRHDALDSRYIGFVDKKDWVATVFW